MKKSTRKTRPGAPAGKRRFSYRVLDVFTQEPLKGNQLAVFTDARGLSDDEMQALARETNLSETTFILPRTAESEREQGIKVRIFTTTEELPFAGHPTLGTATVLRSMQKKMTAEIVLDLAAGRIPVRFNAAEGSPPFGEMRQRDPVEGMVHNREEIARMVGLKLDDLDPDLPIQTFSIGLQFAIVPLRSLKVMRSLRFTWNNVAEYLSRSDAKFLYFVTRETVNAKARLNARMIFYNGEDPATGSAAGCTAAWMVRHGVAQPDEQVMIEQGLDIKRPSEIYVRASLRGDKIDNVRVGGYCVEVARGEVLL
ncbi:MAG TPA: PhzF family phenazine biosynthesis protein [Terriglobales bacterium]